MQSWPNEPPIKDYPWGENENYEEQLKEYLEEKARRTEHFNIFLSVVISGVTAILGIIFYQLYMTEGWKPTAFIAAFGFLAFAIFKILQIKD